MKGKSKITKSKKKSFSKRKLSFNKRIKKTNKRRRTSKNTRKKRKSGGDASTTIVAGAIAAGAIGLGLAYGNSRPPNGNTPSSNHNNKYRFNSTKQTNVPPTSNNLMKTLQTTSHNNDEIQHTNFNNNTRTSGNGSGSGSAYKNKDIDEQKKLAEITIFFNEHVIDPTINRDKGLDIDSMLSVIKEEGVHKNNKLWENLKENIKPINSKNDNKVKLTPDDIRKMINLIRAPDIKSDIFNHKNHEKPNKVSNQTASESSASN